MNAVDVTARGLARRAAQAGEVLASPAGAGAIGVARGGTLQDFVDRPLGRIRLESLGFAESNTAAGNAAILRAALDLGPCTCGEGDFPLENFLWKSGDDFWGAGHGTHFVAGAGIVMKFGCLAGNSMTPGDPESGPSYAIEPPARGDAAITLASAADAAQFTAGDVVLVWSSTGYADGYGEFKPAFQQMNIALAGNVLAAQLVDHQSGSIDADATDLVIEIGGYVANANDQLFIDCTAVTPPIRDVT